MTGEDIMRQIIDMFIKEGMEKTLKKYSEYLPHEQFLKATTIPDKSEYVFEWNGFSENDKENVREFLSRNLRIGWAKTAKIKKIDTDNIIEIYTDKNSLLLELNEMKTEVDLKVDGALVNKFMATMENGELNVYKRGRKTSDHVRKVVEKLDYLLNGDIAKAIDMETPESEIFKDYNECKVLKTIVDKLSPQEKKLLLCAAFYHDIGKSIIFPRHGPEGADVIKDSGSKERKQFRDLGFERYDFYFMSDLVRFHDYLGMLCTGEVSYLIMAEALNPVSNISLSNENYSKKFFDFLFLLNIADIAGTIEKVDREDITIMSHDLKLIRKVYEMIEDTKIFKYEENREVVSELLKLSENHTQERLRRLLRNGFKNLYKINSEELQEYIKWINDRKANTIPFPLWFLRDYQKNTNDIIPLNSSLRAINIKPDFCTKFAHVCKLDYFLGFLRDLFEKLIMIESKKIIDSEKKGSHDLRRDFSMTLMELIDVLVEQYGDFTSNNTKIGLGFERYQELKDMKCHDKMLMRLTGVEGEFKESEAFTKLRNMAVLWVIRP